MKSSIPKAKNLVFSVVKAVIGKWRYFLILAEKRGRGIKTFHYTDIATHGNDLFEGCLFVSNGMTPMGGLCDILKGMISTYGWCKEHQVPFKVLFTHPFILDRYLVPNLYDWTVDEDKVSFNRSESVVVCLMYTFDIADLVDSGEAIVKTQKYFDNKLSYSKHGQVHVYANAQTPYANAHFATLFNELFAPHPMLKERLDSYRQNLGNNYISISFRFTTLLGDFQDCTGAPLSSEESEEYIKECLNAIVSISDQAVPHTKILITADSTKFLSRVNIPGCYIIPGQIGHIQFNSGDEMHMKTFLDLMMISGAQEVYLVKYKKMYNSGFAKTAAMIGSRPFKLYDPLMSM